MDTNQINSLVLAYLGDSIYELLVRDYFIKSGINKVNNLQNKVTRYVSAKGQSQIINYLIDNNKLNDNEKEVVKRGRNAKVVSHPKNIDILTYKWATSLECLFGYLYVKDDNERIKELFNEVMRVDL